MRLNLSTKSNNNGSQQSMQHECRANARRKVQCIIGAQGTTQQLETQCSLNHSTAEGTYLIGKDQQLEIQGSQNNYTTGCTNNSGHKACERVVAIHWSQHAVPEARTAQSAGA
ncbi:hypothetical protein F511_12294 [Dorcoceras hygrometricum]|uniref:Uncharacterized protein n=1 Tax=Dorcoceras hygrometricum TaxID=472368 RepID=A0A2Z7BXE4_9LAMI|nr:hypothetical protein F511_12294 [Dorcoceras hygrometricum]